MADALSAVKEYRENNTVVDREERVLFAQLEGDESGVAAPSAAPQRQRSWRFSSTPSRYSRLDEEAGAADAVDDDACDACSAGGRWEWAWGSLQIFALHEVQVMSMMLPLVAIVNADAEAASRDRATRNVDVTAVVKMMDSFDGPHDGLVDPSATGSHLRVMFYRILPVYLAARTSSLAFEAVARVVLLIRAHSDAASLACKASFGWPSTAILFSLFLASVPIWFLYFDQYSAAETPPDATTEPTTRGAVCAFGCPFGGLMQWLWRPTRRDTDPAASVWAGLGQLPRFWPIVLWLLCAAASRISLEVPLPGVHSASHCPARVVSPCCTRRRVPGVGLACREWTLPLVAGRRCSSSSTWTR